MDISTVEKKLLNKKYLTTNYTNVNLKSLKSKFTSTTNEYIKKLTKEILNKKFNLIEIHNRPLILTGLSKKIDKKFIFYFHNDPLSMKGSKSVNERL